MRKRKWQLLDLADLVESCTKIKIFDAKTKILILDGEVEDIPYEYLRCIVKNLGNENGTIKVRINWRETR